MKMVMAIINDEDAYNIMNVLTEQRFSVTKLATTGGFLRAGNTTIMCGVDDERLEDLMTIIEKQCKSRKQITTVGSMPISGADSYVPYPVEVTVGGATIFVMNVEQFRKV